MLIFLQPSFFNCVCHLCMCLYIFICHLFYLLLVHFSMHMQNLCITHWLNSGNLGSVYATLNKLFIGSTQVHLALLNIQAPSHLINIIHCRVCMRGCCSVTSCLGFVSLTSEQVWWNGTVARQVLIKRVLVYAAFQVSLSRKPGLQKGNLVGSRWTVKLDLEPWSGCSIFKSQVWM